MHRQTQPAAHGNAIDQGDERLGATAIVHVTHNSQELGNDGYGLTPSGVQLSRIMLDLSRWAEQALGAPPRSSR